ncbi:MAG TPA: hypothetical protein VGA56_05805 [Opitutaceae bacterium]
MEPVRLADGRIIVAFNDTLPDGRERWGIYSATGQLQTFRFTKEDAVAWDRGAFFVVHQFVGR